MMNMNKPGTPTQYAEAMKAMVEAGYDLEALNKANHTALENKQITLKHFMAAAQVLASVILAR